MERQISPKYGVTLPEIKAKKIYCLGPNYVISSFGYGFLDTIMILNVNRKFLHFIEKQLRRKVFQKYGKVTPPYGN